MLVIGLVDCTADPAAKPTGSLQASHLNACHPIAADKTCRQAVRSLTMASVRTAAPLKLDVALIAVSLISMAVQASAMYITGSLRQAISFEHVRRMKATLYAWLACKQRQACINNPTLL